MTVTVCPRRPRVDDSPLTTSERPPLVANGCISDAIITMSRGPGSDERVRGRGDAAVVLVLLDGRAGALAGARTGAAAAFFRAAGAAPVGDVARAAVAGFEAFRRAALEGSDPDAVRRFLAIDQSSAVACAENPEFSMPDHIIAATAVSGHASRPTKIERKMDLSDSRVSPASSTIRP